MPGEHQGMTHEERMEIARSLHTMILDTHGEAILAVLVTSSTAKGLDLPYSDLELTAVTRDGSEIEGQSYYYRGLLIEIDYPEASKLLRSVRQVTALWPIVADGYRDIIILFERDGWTRQLRQALDERDASDFSRGIRMSLTTMLEDRDKVRNAQAEGDGFGVIALAADVGYWAANVVLFLNRRPMITTRWFYRRAFECPDQPPAFRALVELLRGVVHSSVDQVARTVEQLCDAVTAMARARGITVESDTLLV